MIRILLVIPRWLKKIIFILHDIVLVFCSFWLALGLRLPIIPEWQDAANWQILAGTSLVSIVTFAKLGLYRAVIRYAGSKILIVVSVGSLLSVAAMLATAFYFKLPLPRSVPVMYFLLLVVSMIGSRFTIKGLLQSQDKSINHPVIIYGAGRSGRQLLEAVKQTSEYHPVAFVDDDKSLHKTVIHNTPVHASSELPKLVERYGVESILLAIPSAGRQLSKQLITRLESLPCKILSMPGLKDLVEGKVSINNLKKVSVIDLLGRKSIEPDIKLMQENITKKVVMVTGAGGSIGSELCRQIIQQSPKVLILFELSEFSLYTIEQELGNTIREKNLAIKLIPAMGSVQHLRRLTELMKHFQVETIYHAAAYKHVPLVEYNTIEGVRNNVFGTLHCAQAAIEAGANTFVLISTDKAVRPTNTMGASKRMAELILQALAEKANHKTRFCMVRFGNVLGSSGSVIPLFERQIAAGGPITLTHPDITRFFMTIPEAAQLVIQAGAMGQGGDVFLLDMGDPIKIIDLARQMIRLSGLGVRDEQNINGDIEIVITGLRPGEKLYEELLIGENPEGTNHKRIMTSKELMLPWSDLQLLLLQLEEACKAFDPRAVHNILVDAPIAFKPSDGVVDILTTTT